MKIGRLDSRGDPLVQLAVVAAGGEERRHEMEAVLDTGFSGFLALPSDVIEALGLEQVGWEEFVTASGAKYFPGKYEAIIVFGRREQMVEIVEAAEPLIGAALLSGYKVCITYEEGGPVEIEAVP